jgi:hypothetical protein
MSEIKVDTLTGKTTANDITVTVGATATMSLEQGLAKAWVNFNGTGTVAISDSLNVSGLVDNGTGDYSITYSSAFNTVSYLTTSGCREDLSNIANTSNRVVNPRRATAAITTGLTRLGAVDFGYAVQDVQDVFALYHGDLA